MEVETVAKTPNPEEVIFRAARQDYYDGYVYDHTVEELLEGCEGNTVEEFLHKRMDREEWGIFEHPSISFAVKGISREVLAHLTRHRFLTFDVQSMRYADFSDATFTVPRCFVDDDYANRHGPVEIDDRREANHLYREHCNAAIERYQELVEMGVPKEDARKVLPIATTVNLTVSGNPRALMHVLNLRMKFNAQDETRELADMLYEELYDWVPSVCSWYDEHGPLRSSP